VPVTGSRKHALFVVSAQELWDAPSALASRASLIAKAVAQQGADVVLCWPSAPGTATRVQERISVLGTGDDAPPAPLAARIIAAPFLHARLAAQVSRAAAAAGGNVAVLCVPSGAVLFDLEVPELLRRQGLRVFLELCERWSALGVLVPRGRGPVRRARRWIRRNAVSAGYALLERTLARYSGVVAISTRLEQLALPQNPRVIRVPALCDAGSLRESARPPQDRSRHAAPDRLLKVGFAGWLSIPKEGLDVVYRAMALAASSGLRVELDLWGAVAPEEKEEVLRCIPEREGLSGQVRYHGHVPRQDLLPLLAACDLLLLPRPSNVQTEFGFSTKLAEYLTTGVPVLATRVSDVALYLEDDASALLVRPGDPRDLCSKFLHAAALVPRTRARIAASGHEAARRHFHYQNWGKPLFRFLFEEV